VQTTSPNVVQFDFLFHGQQNGLNSIDHLRGKALDTLLFCELRGEYGFVFIEKSLKPFRTRRSRKKADRFLKLSFIVRIAVAEASAVQPNLPS